MNNRMVLLLFIAILSFGCRGNNKDSSDGQVSVFPQNLNRNMQPAMDK